MLGRHLGFTDDRVTTFRVDPPFTTTNLPLARLDVASPRVLVEGQQAGRDDERPFVNFQLVSPG